jgi:hypothetical protein
MKNLFFILFLIFPFTLFSQESEVHNLPLIFSLKSDELRTLVMSKSTQIKMSDEEIDKLSKIIDEKKEEYFKLVDQVKKSVPVDLTGRPVGKADPELRRERDALYNEVCTSIYKIFNEKRYKQLYITLVNEYERRNMERLKNAGKSNKK